MYSLLLQGDFQPGYYKCSNTQASGSSCETGDSLSLPLFQVGACFTAIVFVVQDVYCILVELVGSHISISTCLSGKIFQLFEDFYMSALGVYPEIKDNSYG